MYPCPNKNCKLTFSSKLARRNHFNACPTPDELEESSTERNIEVDQIDGPFHSRSASQFIRDEIKDGEFTTSNEFDGGNSEIGEEQMDNCEVTTNNQSNSNISNNETEAAGLCNTIHPVHSFLPASDDIICSGSDSFQDDHEVDEDKGVQSDEEFRKRKKACLSLSVGIYRLSRKVGINSTKELIYLLNDESLRIEDIRNSISSFQKCKRNVENCLSTQIKSDGFNELRLVDDYRNECVLFTRNIIAVLKDQVSYARRSELYTTVEEAVFHSNESGIEIAVHSHPVAANLGKIGIKEIKSSIESSLNLDHVWYGASSTAPSCPGFLQLYSDKSHSTLRALSFVFYPIHIVLLNFSEDIRKRLIVSGKTIVGYLPTKFLTPESSSTNSRSPGLPRRCRIRLLHQAIREILKPVNESFYHGFEVETKDKIRLTMHATPANYVSDIPEAKDLTGVRHNITGTRNCFKCLVLSSNMSKVSSDEPRCLREMKKVIRKHHGYLSQAEQSEDAIEIKNFKELATRILSDYSVESYGPALSMGPLADRYIFDPYQMFTFDILHYIHLGMTRTKLLLFHQRIKALSSRSTALLSRCNDFLNEVDYNFRTTGVRVNFVSLGKSCSLNGLFSDEGIIGMLEGKHYKNIETFMPFIGAICDRFLNSQQNNSTLSVSKLFTIYIDMLHMIYRVGKDKYWTTRDIKQLETQIALYKVSTVNVFKSYQRSEMKLMKFHLLDHLVEDIKVLGSLSIGSSNIFEFTHVLFKRLYNTTSKRELDGLRVTVKRMEEHLFMDKWSECQENTLNSTTWDRSERTLQTMLCPSASKAKFSDLASISTPFVITTINLFTDFISFLERHKENINISEKTINYLNEITELVGVENMPVLHREIMAVIRENNFTRNCKAITIGFSKSFYIASIIQPNNSNGIRFGDGTFHVHVKHSLKRYLYRIVSAKNYRNSKGIRQDSIMLLNRSCPHVENGIQCIWFAKVLAILRLSKPNKCVAKDKETYMDYTFVQYLEPVPTSDKIDDEIGCIRIRWERATDNEGASFQSKKRKRNVLDPGKWFGLTPLESVLGMLPMVPADRDCDFSPFDDSGKKEKVSQLSYRSIPWYDQQFYINRFYYYDKDNIYNTNLDG